MLGKAWASLALGRSCLSILIYHRVLPQPDALRPGDPDARAFARRLAFLKDVFNILPLGEALERLAADALPAASLAITFDDGYADNHDVALPILRHYRVPATVFIATGYLDGGRMWNDTVIEAVRAAEGDVLDLRPHDLGVHPIGSVEQRKTTAHALLDKLKYLPGAQREACADRIAAKAGRALPDTLMMSSEQVRELAAAGIEIGAHTVSHPILTALPEDEARREIVDARRQLSALLSRPVALFAYPNGKPDVDFSTREVALVKEAGFSAAFTTARSVARRDTDRHRIPRFTPWDRSNARFAVRLAQNARSRI